MDISGKTKLACLLGSPVAHSLSPAMHNLSFELNDIDFKYVAFDIRPNELGSALIGLRALGFIGFNLTMPLKKDIIPLLDDISPVSMLCGAVNTVKIENQKLYGTTTDGVGFYDSLLYEEGIDLNQKSMVLLGAGGAATAIAAEGAINHLSRLYIFRRKNENWQNTQDFVDNLRRDTSCDIYLCDIGDENALRDAIGSSAVLCNATNVGMGDDTASPVPIEVLSPNTHVADIIYHPDVTPLMKDANSIGAKASNGKYMLLYQGAAAFKIWTGKDMPISQVKEKVFG